MSDKQSRHALDRPEAERIAIEALAFLVADPERIGRFLALTGLGPETIRVASRDSSFLAGVLDHLAADEPLLLAFASESRLDPAAISRARDCLSTPPA